jgi:hypothetical protein
MTTLRSYLDPDKHTAIVATPIMTELHDHEVRCGMCAKEIYVDEETHRLGSEEMRSGLDNPFRCEVCAEEYDDLVYEG